jgi:hypothetical protein
MPQAADYVPRLRQRLTPLFMTLLISGVLVAGWLQRNEGHLTPEHGAGYWLGLVGGSAMLVLLLYPLRKRWRFMRVLGSTMSWFRLHMLLGLLGPVLILFHANFKLGSTNSNVALLSMLLVAASGIVGRYFYGKIHLGLYGRKADVSEILADAASIKAALGHDLPLADRIIDALNAFSDKAINPSGGAVGRGVSLILLGARAHLCQRRLLAEASQIISVEGKARGWSRRARRQRLNVVRDQLNVFFRAVRKAAAFSFFERLFALWHVLHLPLFVLLIFTATLHVFAVHIY